MTTEGYRYGCCDAPLNGPHAAHCTRQRRADDGAGAVRRDFNNAIRVGAMRVWLFGDAVQLEGLQGDGRNEDGPQFSCSLEAGEALALAAALKSAGIDAQRRRGR